MKHVSEGTLRRLIDEPFTITDRDRQHIETCDSCSKDYARVLADSSALQALMEVPTVQVSAQPALARVHQRLEAPPALSAWRRRTGRRLVRPFGALATVAALTGAVALTPAGSWAQSFVTIFQPSQVVAVPVTLGELRALPDMRQYGIVQFPKQVKGKNVESVAAAEAAAGRPIQVPASLPSDIPATVKYSVMQGTTATFTFQATKARAVAEARGKRLASIPARINGSLLRLTVKPAVMAIYGGSQDLPSLLIGQMPAPQLTSTGVSVKELEDYILGLPGVPSQLANELRLINDPASTLPIPFPVDKATATNVIVQGVQGVSIGDQTGVGSVIFWAKGGMLYGVGGTLPQTEALSIANSLHQG